MLLLSIIFACFLVLLLVQYLENARLREENTDLRKRLEAKTTRLDTVAHELAAAKEQLADFPKHGSGGKFVRRD